MLPVAVTEADGRNRLHSLNSSLDVLEALAAAGGEVGVSELSRRLGRSKATLHAILSNLCARGYVSRDTVSARYRLGLRTWELGMVAVNRLDLPRLAKPHLSALTARTAESSHLSVYDAGEVLYLEKVASPSPVQALTRVGGRAPVHCVSTGKVLLAHQPAEEIERLCRAGLTKFTPLTLTTTAELSQELAKIREVGYAVNRGEWREEVMCVAAPIHDHAGEVIAAVGLSVPAYRFTADRVPSLAGDVRATARQIGSQLGHRERLDTPWSVRARRNQ
jgi:DNA-binding IclR family transcriptional regulator